RPWRLGQEHGRMPALRRLPWRWSLPGCGRLSPGAVDLSEESLLHLHLQRGASLHFGDDRLIARRLDERLERLDGRALVLGVLEELGGLLLDEGLFRRLPELGGFGWVLQMLQENPGCRRGGLGRRRGGNRPPGVAVPF